MGEVILHCHTAPDLAPLMLNQNETNAHGIHPHDHTVPIYNIDSAIYARSSSLPLVGTSYLRGARRCCLMDVNKGSPCQNARQTQSVFVVGFSVNTDRVNTNMLAPRSGLLLQCSHALRSFPGGTLPALLRSIAEFKADCQEQ
jgi:hypothetical protein